MLAYINTSFLLLWKELLYLLTLLYIWEVCMYTVNSKHCVLNRRRIIYKLINLIVIAQPIRTCSHKLTAMLLWASSCSALSVSVCVCACVHVQVFPLHLLNSNWNLQNTIGIQIPCKWCVERMYRHWGWREKLSHSLLSCTLGLVFIKSHIISLHTL